MALTPSAKFKLIKDVEQNYKESTSRLYMTKMLERCDKIPQLREQHLKRIQQIEIDKQLEIEEEAKQRNKDLSRAERLAIEVDQMKKDEFKELKLRQLIRENSPELRELESKLRAAYVTKELMAQMAEKEQEKLNNKRLEIETHKILQSAWLKDEEYKKKNLEEEMKKKYHYRQELQDQMIVKDKKKRYMYEEFLREKKMIDEIIERIHEEDQRELERKMCIMQKTREEMEAFRAAQDIWKRKEREELELENERIQKFLHAKEADLKSWKDEKEKQERIREEINQKIAKQIFELEEKKREKEEMIQELKEEELRQIEERKHKEETEKEIRKRIETRNSLLMQMEERQERAKREADEDAKYKEALIAKMVEDEKLEQMSAQKRRMKMLQFGREVEEMIRQRRQKRAEELQALMKVHEEEKMQAEQRRKIIEEERLRMLRQHAQNLLGFLPKGVLRSDDFALLDHLEK